MMVNFKTSPPEEYGFSTDPREIVKRLTNTRTKKTNFANELMGNGDLGGKIYRIIFGLDEAGNIGDVSLGGKIEDDSYGGVPLSGNIQEVFNRLMLEYPNCQKDSDTIADPDNLCWICFEEDRATGIGWWNPEKYNVQEFLRVIT